MGSGRKNRVKSTQPSSNGTAVSQADSTPIIENDVKDKGTNGLGVANGKGKTAAALPSGLIEKNLGILRSENSALAEELAEARSEKKDLLISQREAQASLKVLKEKVRVESDRAEAFEKAYASAVKRNYIYGGLAVTASAIAIVALVSKPK